MNETRNKDKHKGIYKLIYKVKYSLSGLIYFYKTEFSAIIISFCIIALVILGLIFNISALEWLLILITMGSVLSTEILNTAQEVTIDMVTNDYNVLAKYSKDLGSAATFISSLIAFVVFCVIFIPKILSLF